MFPCSLLRKMSDVVIKFALLLLCSFLNAWKQCCLRSLLDGLHLFLVDWFKSIFFNTLYRLVFVPFRGIRLRLWYLPSEVWRWSFIRRFKYLSHCWSSKMRIQILQVLTLQRILNLEGLWFFLGWSRLLSFLIVHINIIQVWINLFDWIHWTLVE